ncbi:MAG: STAS domain-containing protein [Spirochaetia bacterium]|nr:STAS domain-containing protein [Spirochaetia bacterium]
MIRTLPSPPERLVVRLETDLKMENVREFYEDLIVQLAPQHTEIIVDFGSIRFVDSSGIGILLQLAKELSAKKLKFGIYGLNRALHSVFKLAGLLKIFRLLTDEDAQAYPELTADR